MDEAKAKAEHDAAVAKGENPPPVEEEPELVSRPVQGGIGLFTGVTVYNVAFGGLFALAFAILLRPDGRLEPARDLGADRAQRLPRRLRRADPQISGEPAVDRQPRHDRSAHGDLFRHDPVVARLDDRRLERPQSPRSISSARGMRRWSAPPSILSRSSSSRLRCPRWTKFPRASRPWCCGSSAWLRSARRRSCGRCSGSASARGSNAISREAKLGRLQTAY